jgi:antitoxin (DNA-binding transcriptional repressor) of toxin-antitoxin stability system
MKPVSVAYAKNNLSALLRKVRAGHAIMITDRGVPVAQLVAPGPTAGVSARFIDLAERGLVRLPEHEPTADWDRLEPAPPRFRKGASAVQALLDERRSGR